MTRKQEKEPASTEVTEVAAGVLRMQLPIRFPGLGHVNAYAIEDRRGVTVIDPGMPGPGTWRALGRRLRAADVRPRHVHTVVITHSHPDHFGGARRLARAGDAEIVTHADFRAWWTAPHAHPDDGDDDGDGGDDGDDDGGGDHDGGAAAAPPTASGSGATPWARPTPWGGRSYRPPLRRRAAYRLLGPLLRQRFLPPEPTRRVVDGEVLHLGDRDWLALHTPGHTLDHLCLLDPAGGVLLSGDHVLPTITPHISGVGTGADPLAGFLDSLERVGSLAEVTTVLPAHGHPFTDLAGRAKEIARHHEERLARLRVASHRLGPATVADLSRQIFSRRAWGSMAESETYAHLEHLRRAGDAERWEERGRLLYQVR